MNEKRVTSPSNVKAYALKVAKDTGRAQFSRVSKDFTDRIEARTRTMIANEIARHPSLGVTLK